MRLFLAVLLCCLAGCSTKPAEFHVEATINGKPVVKGQPVSVSPKDDLDLKFSVVGLTPDGAGRTWAKVTLDDMSFTCANHTRTTFTDGTTWSQLQPGVREQVINATDAVAGKSAELRFTVEVK